MTSFIKDPKAIKGYDMANAILQMPCKYSSCSAATLLREFPTTFFFSAAWKNPKREREETFFFFFF
jgi:hypothetical protein